MSTPWVIQDADLNELGRLASFLALVLKPGDVVALSGDLGAGKTTLARAVILALLGGRHEEIPSPTFALMQTYEDGRLPLAHIDCYRMTGADELFEIGLDDALTRGAALIEWAERALSVLPADRLDISLKDGSREDCRTITLAGHGKWRARAKRLKAMMAFCVGSDWARARPDFLQGDASSRTYARLHMDGTKAILMDSPARADSEAIRGGKSYSALVHLAEDVKPFVAIANALERAGVSVPRILDHDLSQGFLIIEDLGKRVFTSEAGQDPPLEELYSAAADVLVSLRGSPPVHELPLPDGSTHAVPQLSADVLEIEAELLLDWFYPCVHGGACPGSVRAEFLAALRALFPAIEGRDDAWVLRDYHSPNLLWLPERKGSARVGVIDFQDALIGHAAYDLVSLLQDARRDIGCDLEGRLYAHYCEARAQCDSGFGREAFGAAYAGLGAQRSSKILGIFARLAKRDGKHGYLAHIPRVSAYLERNLAHPGLKPLRAWFDEHLPQDMRTKALEI
ncbi:MAG: tRNA (adenosine(37)-N6)-threonylcarbamoyltransferase complex ATPase subunit type 1 TsaE [Alphaproteobacteria bacterium]